MTELPTTEEGWHEYRSRLVRAGRDAQERMNHAPTLPEREQARQEWERIADQTDVSERAYDAFLRDKARAEVAQDADDLGNQLWNTWVRPRSENASSQVLTRLAASDQSGAGRPAGLDEEGLRLQRLAATLVAEPETAARVPREVIEAITAALREFAGRLMLARSKGELTEGDEYVRAVLLMVSDLESRRFNA